MQEITEKRMAERKRFKILQIRFSLLKHVCKIIPAICQKTFFKHALERALHYSGSVILLLFPQRR